MQGGDEFAGKSVLITGAGGGVGSALVDAFAGKGARLIGCDQTDDALQAAELSSRYVFDLLDYKAAEEAAKAVLAKDGVPDIIVNNAGWTRAERMNSLTSEKIVREIDLNLTGVMVFTDTLVKAMAKRGQGSLVFISSINSIGHFGNPAYSAAKAGINAYARAIAVEFGRMGVRANVVCPGSIRTPAWDHRLSRDTTILAKLQKIYPLGRIVNTGEVAEAVMFLASDRASGITGVVLPVDAGLSAGCLPFIDDVLGE